MKQSTNTIKNLNLLQNDIKNIFEILLSECYKQGINAQISESIRTKEKQLELYNSGKSKAKEAYQSLHFYGLACDIFVNNAGKYDLSQNEKIWKICQDLKLDLEHGMTWGGNFKSIKDQPHFELSWGRSWKFFYQEWKNKNTNFNKANNPFDTILSEWSEFINFYIS